MSVAGFPFPLRILVVGLALAMANVPAHAELIIGISFPSRESMEREAHIAPIEQTLLSYSSQQNSTNSLNLTTALSSRDFALLVAASQILGITNKMASADNGIASLTAIRSAISTNGLLRATLRQNILELDWSADLLGWVLQSQTNQLGPIDTQWFPVVDSAGTNHVSLPIDFNQSSVFFRLMAP